MNTEEEKPQLLMHDSNGFVFADVDETGYNFIHKGVAISMNKVDHDAMAQISADLPNVYGYNYCTGQLYTDSYLFLTNQYH